MTRAEEFAAKLLRVQALLDSRNLRSIVLRKHYNLAWLLAGAEAFVQQTADRGSATAVVTQDACHVVANNIEGPRLVDEELVGLPLELHQYPWHDDRSESVIAELAGERHLSDTGPSEGDIADLQTPLLESEVLRYESLGREAGEALGAAMQAVRPGMTENRIAALIASEVLGRGMAIAVLLVAADERTRRYRHPLPTSRPCTRYAMGVVVCRRGGLHASLTRSVHFGPVPEDLEHRHAAATVVDAMMIDATVPGAKTADVFEAARATYEAVGFPGEWEHHHQGGPTGYRPRTARATPKSPETIRAEEAYAWNPTVAGAKSEDTILCTGTGPRILTPSPGWPCTDVEVDGRLYPRPDILVL